LAVKLARDTRRQWLQFAAVAFTLALGVAVFGAAYDSYHNLKSSYGAVYDRLAFADATITGGDTEAIAAEAKAIDGALDVETRRQADAPFRVGSSGDPHSLLGRIVTQPADGGVNRLLVRAGTWPDPAHPDGVAAESHMADHFKLRPGDVVEVFAHGEWQQVPIVAVVVSPEYLWPARDSQDLLTTPDDFGVLFVSDGFVGSLDPATTVHQVIVRYATNADHLALDAQMQMLAAAHGAGDTMLQADQPSNAALQQDVDGFGQLAVLFPLLFLCAGGLAAYVLLGRMVRAQRGEIGMLVANGYPPRRLLYHYIGFGAVAGAGGSLVGAAGGVGLAVWLTRTYASSLHIPLAVAHLHPFTPLVGAIAGTIAGIAAAAGPARAATRVSPADAMRGLAPTAVGHQSALEHLPGVRRLPVRARLTIRNVRRSPRRALSTGTGVALAAVLVLSSLGMLDTVSLVFDDQFHHIQRQDAQLYLAQPASAADLSAIPSVPGVAAVEPSVEVRVVLTSGDRRYQTSLQGFAPNTTMHEFPEALPNDGVVLGDGLRSLLRIDVGDTVDVTVGNAAPVPVPVTGFVHEPLGSLAYTTLATAQQLAGSNGLPSLLLRYTGDAAPETMRQRLAGQPGVLAIRDIRGSEEAVRQLLELFYAIVGVMLLFGSLLAFVVLFNTLSVNLAERTGELATLRAAGARLTTLARMITAENLLLVIAAIPVGLAAGWLTGRWLMSSFNSDLYHFTLRLRPTTPLLLAVALVAVTMLTHVPARRNLRRLDVARVVRERSL
jgi:putative ABC transport system permease protein